jgi:inhibitor of cysteine peptidase
MAAILATALAACGGGDDDGDGRLVVEAEDAGADVIVEVGDEFEIRLDSNPTTGYAWQVVAAPDGVELVAATFEEPDTDLVGAGGIETFVFVGATEGSGELRLEYVRSFDDPPVPAEVVQYQVQVSAP